VLDVIVVEFAVCEDMMHVMFWIPPSSTKSIDKIGEVISNLRKSLASTMSHGVTHPPPCQLTDSKSKNTDPPHISQASNQKTEGYECDQENLYIPSGFIKMFNFVQDSEIFLRVRGRRLLRNNGKRFEDLFSLF
jgi:hypothetical protein